jgi:hypothetical protein
MKPGAVWRFAESIMDSAHSGEGHYGPEEPPSGAETLTSETSYFNPDYQKAGPQPPQPPHVFQSMAAIWFI